MPAPKLRPPNAAAGYLRKASASAAPKLMTAPLKVFSSLFSMLWPGKQDQPLWKTDFISVIACAQRYGIDFLSITWQEAQVEELNILGKGGQSSIFQSAVSLKEEFAFKTSSPIKRHGGVQNIHDIFRELLVQVSIHGHPALRNHPNILRLEALGWELEDPQALETPVWPVLIFEKTKHKSLEAFVDSKEGRDLDLRQRLGLCANIASALATMHANKAFHLDLKPDNVLIFDAKDCSFVAKLGDFGLSKIATKETGLRRRTMWSAPEHDETRKYSASQLERIEVYMFGILCLWILFHEKLTSLKDIETDTDVLKNYEELLSDKGDIRRDYLAWMALTIVGSEKVHAFVDRCVATVDSQMLGKLSFLKGLLCENPEERWTLSKTGLMHESEFIRTESKEHDLSDIVDNTIFQIPPALPALCRADYRVRRYIATSLKTLVETERASDALKAKAAFQVILCQRLGFAGNIDDSAALLRLKAAGIDLKDIDDAIQKVKLDKENQVFHNKMLQHLYDDGIITPLGQATEFKKLQSYGDIGKKCVEEIQDMENVLGSVHPAVLNLKWNLESILFHSPGEEDSQERLILHLEAMVRDLKKSLNYGDEHKETASAQGDLALAYLNNTMFEEGEELVKSTYDLLLKTRGKGDILTCVVAANFATAMDARFRTKIAKELLDTAITGLEARLGKRHIRTLSFSGLQARQYIRLGLFDEAIKRLEFVLEELPKLLPEHDETVMQFRSEIIMCLDMAGRHAEAEAKAWELRKVLEAALRKGGGESRHPPPDFVDFIIGNLQLHQAKFREAAEIFYTLRPPNILVSIIASWTRTPLPEAVGDGPARPQGPTPQQSQSGKGYTPDDFPFNVQLVNLLILESQAKQAQAKLDNDNFALRQAAGDIGTVIGVLNKVLGKETWPELNPDEGIKGSYLQTALTKGLFGSVELLLSIGANNARDGLHYQEAIEVAKQRGLDHISALLEEHQLLCGRIPESGPQNLDPKILSEFFTGKWSGNYLWTAAPGFRLDKFKGREMSLLAQVSPDNPKCLLVTGTGEDDLGPVKVEGEAWTSGAFVLYFGLGDGDTKVGWEYSGTVNLSRHAIGGIWSHRNSPVALGTFYFFNVEG
ncbi:kinase-like protein [Xylariaceae sp. AK1471]|nr:kinase-like protein [Xylariaceae sp. AK1471]